MICLDNEKIGSLKIDDTNLSLLHIAIVGWFRSWRPRFIKISLTPFGTDNLGWGSNCMSRKWFTPTITCSFQHKNYDDEKLWIDRKAAASKQVLTTLYQSQGVRIYVAHNHNIAKQEPGPCGTDIEKQCWGLIIYVKSPGFTNFTHRWNVKKAMTLAHRLDKVSKEQET